MATVFKRGGKKSKGPYYVQWYDHNGIRRSKCTHTTDKATAERIARKHEADAALRRDGVIDPALDAIGKESQRTVEEHLADYEAKLRAGGRTDQHIRQTTKYIHEITAAGGFRSVGDINADAVTRFASALLDVGKSARTAQAYLTAVKGFTRWLTDNHKLPRDPLSSVKKPNPKADRRRVRRMLLVEEWPLLKSATEAGPGRYGMTADERVLLYDTAIQTGLRSNELRSLTRGGLYFDSEQPYITCKAGTTKNRKDARQYIRPDLAASLSAHIATKAPKTPVFNLPHKTEVARMFRDDLAEARKRWLSDAKDDPQEYANRDQSDFLTATNHEGEMMDFHSLRHTCGAWLAKTGAHPKTVQSVMRHQSITLTMDTYGHLFPGQEAEAADRLGAMLVDHNGDPEALRATGTDDHTTKGAQQLAQQLGRETLQAGANGCNTRNENIAKAETHKPLQIADLCDVVQDNAPESDSAPSRTQTLNLRITNQVVSPLQLNLNLRKPFTHRFFIFTSVL